MYNEHTQKKSRNFQATSPIANMSTPVSTCMTPTYCYEGSAVFTMKKPRLPPPSNCVRLNVLMELREMILEDILSGSLLQKMKSSSWYLVDFPIELSKLIAGALLKELLQVMEARKQRQRIKELFEALMTRFERSIRTLASRLQIMLSFFLILCKSSGFPTDPGQTSCSTMPWNIRPALVVLWGVCWMFARPPSQVDARDRFGVKDGVEFTILGKFTQYVCLVFAPTNMCHRTL